MAKFIQFDPINYGPSGLISLAPGDDWKLTGKVQELFAANQIDADLAGISGASGFFPAASGGVLTGLVTIVDTLCGRFTLTLPGAVSTGVQPSETGIQPYLTLQLPSGLVTVYPLDQPLQVQPRGFTNV